MIALLEEIDRSDRLTKKLKALDKQHKAALAEIERLSETVQTYPTADAYESACAALHKWRDIANAAMPVVEAARCVVKIPRSWIAADELDAFQDALTAYDALKGKEPSDASNL